MSWFSDFWDDTSSSISDNAGSILGTAFALPTGGLSLAAGAAYDATNPDSVIGGMLGGDQKKGGSKNNFAQPIITKADELEEWADENKVDYEEYVKAAQEIAKYNLENLPEVSASATGTALQAGSQIDKALANRFYSNLESVLPDYMEQSIGVQREALTSVKDVADSFIAGELPDDLKAFIERTRAEQNISQGRFGEQARAATARDLGLTSLDLINRGTELQVNAVSPLSSRLLSTAMSLTPPTSDLQAMYGMNMQVASGSGMLNPGQVMQMGSQIGLANAQMAWAGQLSSANMMMDAWQTKMQMDMNRDAMQAAQTNALIGGGMNLFGSLGSAAIMSSDKRLKKNIKQIGMLSNGIRLYQWDWNNIAKKLFTNLSYSVGVIAQEVKEIIPEAVIFGDSGYLMVDYSKILKGV